MIINMLDNFNSYLMVFMTSKIIVFKNISQFHYFTDFLFFFVKLLPSLVMEWSHVFF